MTVPHPPAGASEPVGYDPTAIEAKWRAQWAERGTNATNLDGEQPFYQLMMFPYPSAEGLHIGNLYAFTGNDIHGRFQRMQGHTVLEPLGYDAFGIHSENFALKMGVHPMELIPRNVANFRRQLDRAGLMVDWRRSVDTTDPAYYKWTQWVFLKLYERGLAYKKQAAVNWCPSCKTVLANEQVINGACERCGTPVEQRALEQWFFRITDYAERLLKNLDWIDWSESTRTAQRNWLGRSEGAEIRFRVLDPLTDAGSAGVNVSQEITSGSTLITVFTTRPDTIFGATYLVLAPEHPAVDRVTTPDQRWAVEEYREAARKKDLVSRQVNKEKTGVFTGAYAVNPANGEMIPVWTADYVLTGYGTGAIMAVPGHDERGFEFAQKFNLPITRVVAAPSDTARTPLNAAYTDDADGRLVNSEQFDGVPVADAKRQVTDWLTQRGSAKPITTYRLRDWCVSRQRYWGPPIPIIYCDACGTVPVPEQDLPVVLPNVPDYKPDDSGVGPLARHEAFYHVPCPKCGKTARRETDVSDTFLDSAWYFLRYPSVPRDDVPFDAAITRKWLPVSAYIGGNEHAVLHLLYARFINMVMFDAGLVPEEEPFRKFRAHGMIIRDGAKMSKSRGNVVNPDAYMDQWGADTVRTYLMFIGPFEEGGDFRDQSISGVRRFLDRLWASVRDARRDGAPDADVMRKLHQTIKKVGADIPALSYNTAIAAMMEYMNVLRRGERVPHVAEAAPLVQLVAPFAPHIAEELWTLLGHNESVFDAGWPAFNEGLAQDDAFELVVQVNGKTRGKVSVPRDVTQDAALAAAQADAGIAKFLTGAPKKVIYVPGRLLNIVA
ncbi:MAG: leucine--tRNA ligase [Gemmatimonadaceae bacterium]|nr:leucine--tRNA ligase [Gemmatimonadaceae bacterium]